jgi:BirA family transcriptional regulator, biotin operon repressor / biotin---[acetyl-CoA-carboxylase] ligase
MFAHLGVDFDTGKRLNRIIVCRPSSQRRTVDRLRRILEDHRGEFVSGQDIGRRLGMSRAAVWKGVQRLRREGFGIEGARGAGYRLLGNPDRIGKDDLFARLSCPEFWKAFHYYSIIDSTNVRAAELAEQGAPHGTVVCADEQTRGRGRLGRIWVSPPGVNLYLSLLLRPPLPPHLAPQLTAVTAVALAEAVEETAGVRAGLKWPNDLMLGGKKAAGILAEMSSDLDRLRHVVVGVGLNVNGGPASFPEEIRERATSLLIETERTHARVAILARFLDAFSESYRAFLLDGLGRLLPGWERRDILKGKRVLLRSRDEEVPGTVAGMDAAGALLFIPEGADGAERIVSGEIVDFF